MEERQDIRRKVWTLKQSNSTNTTQFTTLNSTLGFLEQLFNSSGCLTQLCDTLADDLPKDGQGIAEDIGIIVQCNYPSLFIQSIPQSPPYPTLPLFFSI